MGNNTDTCSGNHRKRYTARVEKMRAPTHPKERGVWEYTLSSDTCDGRPTVTSQYISADAKRASPSYSQYPWVTTG